MKNCRVDQSLKATYTTELIVLNTLSCGLCFHLFSCGFPLEERYWPLSKALDQFAQWLSSWLAWLLRGSLESDVRKSDKTNEQRPWFPGICTSSFYLIAWKDFLPIDPRVTMLDFSILLLTDSVYR